VQREPLNQQKEEKNLLLLKELPQLLKSNHYLKMITKRIIKKCPIQMLKKFSRKYKNQFEILMKLVKI